jgi:hypothetical protein
LLYLYQAVDKLQPDNALAVDAVRQVILLGSSSTFDATAGSARWSITAGPLTLAAMCVHSPALPLPDGVLTRKRLLRSCVLPEHQMACRNAFQQCGSQEGYIDNLAAAERVWQVRNGGGDGDWRMILEQHGWQLSFL